MVVNTLRLSFWPRNITKYQVAKESISKTAFITPDGHYEYLRMPFGLVNAPELFQRTINMVLGSLRFTTAFVYMYDVLLPSVTWMH